jgi:hypothetical protein
MDITVEVEQGSITVEYVDIVHQDENCYVFEIGTKEKYPEYAGGNPANLIFLKIPGEDYSATAKVLFRGFEWNMNDPWMMTAETDRYSIVVTVYRDRRTLADRIWEKQ